MGRGLVPPQLGTLADREHIMKHEFADLTIEQLTYLVSADIDPIVVPYKKMREIEDVFGLLDDDCNLTAVRNSVVDTMGALTSKAIERHNVKLYEQLQANMSGVTAVIDHIMMVKGF